MFLLYQTVTIKTQIMELSDFNKKLARTFVKDFGIPVSVISEAHFFYMMHSLGYTHEWSFLVKTLNSFPGIFESQVEQFLSERDRIRDEIVKEITNRPEYQKFNTCDMNVYKHADIQVSKNKEYTQYISIDLKNANIQALHYVNPEITLGENTWDGLVQRINGHNSMSEYIIASKRFRQVVFGMLNPKRAVVVEKYMISKVYDVLFRSNYSLTDVVSFNNDEIVFGTDFPVCSGFSEDFTELILRETGFDVHVRTYNKRVVRMRNLSNYDLTQKFDLITYGDGKTKMRGVPGYLHAIVYQLARGRSVNNNHRHFMNDNMDCMIMDDFVLCDENGNDINEILIKDGI